MDRPARRPRPSGGRTSPGPVLTRLRGEDTLLAVELRPPRADLSSEESREAWIDANHALRRLGRETVVFVTDNAVGSREEENLQHLVSNVEPDVEGSRIVPFLTCKHTLEYCMWYSQRAAQGGYHSLVVLGGDREDGVERCVPHAFELRKRIRREVPDLDLGGWANPHREADRQVGFLLEPDANADFFLTQIVSHYDLDKVERFLSEADRRGLTIPGIFGVFYYRSARPATLRRLARFIPVPADGIREEFDAGVSPDEFCARTIVALRRLGVRRVYISNLPANGAHRTLAGLEEKVRQLEGLG